MEAIGDVLAGMVQRSLQNREPDDYVDEDGFLCCGKCHDRKQIDVTLPSALAAGEGAKTIRVGCMCKCEKERAERKKQEQARRDFESRMDRLRRDGITDPAYLQHTFAQDDQRNPKISDVCRRYVENWAEMKAQNIGILFYGDVGTGKSFLACAIANALLERLVSVSVTNFPRILNSLQGAFDDERQKRIDRLQHYSLLVIDDLGVERDTSYSAEQVYNVIDTRARSGKPVIITTNLSLKDLENPPSLAYKRIYDRVLEMCPIRLKMVGDNPRPVAGTERIHRRGAVPQGQIQGRFHEATGPERDRLHDPDTASGRPLHPARGDPLPVGRAVPPA